MWWIVFGSWGCHVCLSYWSSTVFVMYTLVDLYIGYLVIVCFCKNMSYHNTSWYGTGGWTHFDTSLWFFPFRILGFLDPRWAEMTRDDPRSGEKLSSVQFDCPAGHFNPVASLLLGRAQLLWVFFTRENRGAWRLHWGMTDAGDSQFASGNYLQILQVVNFQYLGQFMWRVCFGRCAPFDSRPKHGGDFSWGRLGFQVGREAVGTPIYGHLTWWANDKPMDSWGNYPVLRQTHII